MKKLIIFSILTACVMSVAQTQDLSKLTAVELAKRSIVIYEDNQTLKKIWILDTKSTNQILQKELETVRKQQAGKQFNMQETLGGGWQPELSQVGRNLDELTLMLGAECSLARVSSFLASENISLEKDEAVEISSLSAHAQDCLRR